MTQDVSALGSRLVFVKVSAKDELLFRPMDEDEGADSSTGCRSARLTNTTRIDMDPDEAVRGSESGVHRGSIEPKRATTPEREPREARGEEASERAGLGTTSSWPWASAAKAHSLSIIVTASASMPR
ncbi:hypothetical protein ACHAWF_008544 [Thalassiosira exigua]